ncbi:hypothetical protein [Clostridium saccharoperbutylacetonicum]|uniref:hypothetical protein n=1 Tax=Clostridium saccharoperbutylacetonicum TaxID=36745 RepID=UPI000983D030|nr:hypothetical protein [Clostridium saccharoperbutylacetonicum]AQR96340.1 hypothetical protein CLSAP_36610 [Clostridium saccharoperbutylacetonicum]NSB32213.1 hypothetical protein [Clostridium saccharoperbutylacetonicum]
MRKIIFSIILITLLIISSTFLVSCNAITAQNINFDSSNINDDFGIDAIPEIHDDPETDNKPDRKSKSSLAFDSNEFNTVPPNIDENFSINGESPQNIISSSTK